MKSLGLISFLFFGAAVSYMLVKWSGDATKTFSQNAARYQTSTVYYSVVWAVSLILLSLFVFGWFVPTLHLSTAFSIVAGVGVASGMVAALVPETEGWRKVTHLVVSSVMYLSTLIVVGILLLHPATPPAGRIIGIFAFAIMTAIFLSVLLFKHTHRYAAALQTVHLICFFAVLLTITYSL